MWVEELRTLMAKIFLKPIVILILFQIIIQLEFLEVLVILYLKDLQ